MACGWATLPNAMRVAINVLDQRLLAGGVSGRAQGGMRAHSNETTAADYFHSVSVLLKLSSASTAYSNTLATAFRRFQFGAAE